MWDDIKIFKASLINHTECIAGLRRGRGVSESGGPELQQPDPGGGAQGQAAQEDRVAQEEGEEGKKGDKKSFILSFCAKYKCK